MEYMGLEMKTFGTLRTSMIAVCMAVMMFSAAANAQQNSADQKKAPNTAEQPAHGKAIGTAQIDQLGWFVGNWRAEVPAQNGNPAVTVDSEMKWAENRRAIIFQVYFTSVGKREPHYFGMYAWDPGDKSLKMVQVASDGNLSIGRATMEGNLFKQDTHMVRSNGTSQEQHAEIVRDGDDAFNWKVQIEKDGKFVDALKLRYERVKDSTKTSGGTL